MAVLSEDIRELVLERFALLLSLSSRGKKGEHVRILQILDHYFKFDLRRPSLAGE